jgi:DNA-binding XRE family transcriptional regulator
LTPTICPPGPGLPGSPFEIPIEGLPAFQTVCHDKDQGKWKFYRSLDHVIDRHGSEQRRFHKIHNVSSFSTRFIRPWWVYSTPRLKALLIALHPRLMADRRQWQRAAKVAWALYAFHRLRLDASIIARDLKVKKAFVMHTVNQAKVTGERLFPKGTEDAPAPAFMTLEEALAKTGHRSLRKLRISLGLTGDQAAKACEVAGATWRMWELGRCRPTQRALHILIHLPEVAEEIRLLYPAPGSGGWNRGTFTQEQKAEIVRRYRAGEATQRELAQEFGVAQGTISVLIRKEGRG